jgi:hypothetical protein
MRLDLRVDVVAPPILHIVHDAQLCASAVEPIDPLVNGMFPIETPLAASILSALGLIHLHGPRQLQVTLDVLLPVMGKGLLEELIVLIYALRFAHSDGIVDGPQGLD